MDGGVKAPEKTQYKETLDLERPAGGPEINSGGIRVTDTRDSGEMQVEESSE